MTNNKPSREQSRRRARNQFRAWLVYELNLRGADLPAQPSYSKLRDAVAKLLAAR